MNIKKQPTLWKIACNVILTVAGLFLFAFNSYAETAEEYYKSGNDHVIQGEFTQAISDFTNAIKMNPNYAKAYCERGHLYVEQNQGLAQSMELTNKANTMGLKHSVVPQKIPKEFTLALSDLNKAIELDPKFLKAYGYRAVAYFYLANYDNAWKDVHKVKELGGSDQSGFIDALKKASGRNK